MTHTTDENYDHLQSFADWQLNIREQAEARLRAITEQITTGLAKVKEDERSRLVLLTLLAALGSKMSQSTTPPKDQP